MLKAKILGFEVVYAKNFTSLDWNALTVFLVFLASKINKYLINNKQKKKKKRKRKKRRKKRSFLVFLIKQCVDSFPLDLAQIGAIIIEYYRSKV